MSAWFEFYRLRVTFQSVHPVTFPPGKPGSMLRGGFGLMLKAVAPEETYRRFFEPLPEARGPSGYSERARPFVFRAAHLDGARIERGQRFWFDFHLFETRRPQFEVLEMAFAQLGREGLGAGRARAELIAADRELMRLPLLPASDAVSRARVEFITPTELKSRDVLVDEPRFGVLLARARDRVSTLRALSGAAPLTVDYKGLGERARIIAMTRCELTQVEVTRRSSRTGQRHAVGGFTGTAEYEGELREFMPWLRAAQFTGVGRQTGFGKGEIRISEPV